jgi:hypothetical protein
VRMQMAGKRDGHARTDRERHPPDTIQTVAGPPIQSVARGAPSICPGPPRSSDRQRVVQPVASRAGRCLYSRQA